MEDLVVPDVVPDEGQLRACGAVSAQARCSSASENKQQNVQCSLCWGAA